MASKKAQLSKMQQDLEGPKEKVTQKEKSKPVPIKEEKPALVAHPARGERTDFLRTSITIPADLLTELKMLGMRRKSKKMRDTDISSLIREAVVDFLNKYKDQ